MVSTSTRGHKYKALRGQAGITSSQRGLGGSEAGWGTFAEFKEVADIHFPLIAAARNTHFKSPELSGLFTRSWKSDFKGKLCTTKFVFFAF